MGKVSKATVRAQRKYAHKAYMPYKSEVDAPELYQTISNQPMVMRVRKPVNEVLDNVSFQNIHEHKERGNNLKPRVLLERIPPEELQNIAEYAVLLEQPSVSTQPASEPRLEPVPEPPKVQFVKHAHLPSPPKMPLKKAQIKKARKTRIKKRSIKKNTIPSKMIGNLKELNLRTRIIKRDTHTIAQQVTNDNRRTSETSIEDNKPLCQISHVETNNVKIRKSIGTKNKMKAKQKKTGRKTITCSKKQVKKKKTSQVTKPQRRRSKRNKEDHNKSPADCTTSMETSTQKKTDEIANRLAYDFTQLTSVNISNSSVKGESCYTRILYENSDDTFQAEMNPAEHEEFGTCHQTETNSLADFVIKIFNSEKATDYSGQVTEMDNSLERVRQWLVKNGFEETDQEQNDSQFKVPTTPARRLRVSASVCSSRSVLAPMTPKETVMRSNCIAWDYELLSNIVQDKSLIKKFCGECTRCRVMFKLEHLQNTEFEITVINDDVSLVTQNMKIFSDISKESDHVKKLKELMTEKGNKIFNTAVIIKNKINANESLLHKEHAVLAQVIGILHECNAARINEAPPQNLEESIDSGMLPELLNCQHVESFDIVDMVSVPNTICVQPNDTQELNHLAELPSPDSRQIPPQRSIKSPSPIPSNQSSYSHHSLLRGFPSSPLTVSAPNSSQVSARPLLIGPNPFSMAFARPPPQPTLLLQSPTPLLSGASTLPPPRTTLQPWASTLPPPQSTIQPQSGASALPPPQSAIQFLIGASAQPPPQKTSQAFSEASALPPPLSTIQAFPGAVALSPPQRTSQAFSGDSALPAPQSTIQHLLEASDLPAFQRFIQAYSEASAVPPPQRATRHIPGISDIPPPQSFVQASSEATDLFPPQSTTQPLPGITAVPPSQTTPEDFSRTSASYPPQTIIDAVPRTFTLFSSQCAIQPFPTAFARPIYGGPISQTPLTDLTQQETVLQEITKTCPSIDEFKECPIKFAYKMQKSNPLNGICAIKPPNDFKPLYKTGDNQINFKVSNQYIHRMLTRWGKATRQLTAIRYIQDPKIQRSPLFEGLEIDLVKLFNTVQSEGGLEACQNDKEKWEVVARKMKLFCRGKANTKLENIYLKYLLSYNTLTNEEREKANSEVEKCWTVREVHSVERAQNPMWRQERMRNGVQDEVFASHLEKVCAEAEECVTPGRTMNYNNFEKLAQQVQKTYFPKNDNPALEDVEGRFWSIVTLGDAHVCVHSASVDASGHGCGFTDTSTELYGLHPWNLKAILRYDCHFVVSTLEHVYRNGYRFCDRYGRALTRLRWSSDNLLSHLGPAIGVSSTSIHYGMMFTTRCWHMDPTSVPWIEYHHSGPPKIWYSISADQEHLFRSAAEALCPYAVQNKSIWLPSDIMMIPPKLLLQYKITVKRCVQNAGEFVIIYPNTYCACIDTGLTVSEGVYFAHHNWFMEVENVFSNLRNNCEPSLFSLEKLMIAMTRNEDTPIYLLQRVHTMLTTMLYAELTYRRALHERNIQLITPEVFLEQNQRASNSSWQIENNGECAFCRCHLHFSRVVGITAGQSGLCSMHGIYLFDNMTRHQQFSRRCSIFCIVLISDDELNSIIREIKDRMLSSIQCEI